MAKFTVVREMLAKLNMDCYIEKFEEAKYDDGCLEDSTDSELREIGLLVGDRKKFLNLLKQNSLAKVINDQLEKFYSHEEFTSFYRLDKTKLSLATCYVNLVVVPMEIHKSKETEEVKSFESDFIRPRSSDDLIYDKSDIIELRDLFENRNKNGLGIKGPWHTAGQKRILIFGRAGIGKTTLCKKIVYNYYKQNLWKNYFHRVVWLALRDLKQYIKHSDKVHAELSDVYTNRFFNKFQDGQFYADLIAQEEKEGKKVLYVLDGWDEIQELLVEGHFMRKVLKDELLKKPFLILTSRPYTMELEARDFDEVLETIGFTRKNINSYVSKVMQGDIENQNKVLNFINSHSITAGLASIPIQLDMLCCLCKSKNTEDLERGLPSDEVTMTKLYDLLVKKMLDINNTRKQKTTNFEWITSDLKKCFQDYRTGNCPDIAHIMFLSQVAYKGFLEDKIEFNDTFFSSVNTAKDIRNAMKESHFFNCINPSEIATEYKSYTFIHLTFQEFMAAVYVVHCLERDEMVKLVAQYKYHPRFQIVWSFVAGLIEDSEDLEKFFDYLEDAPIEITGLPHQFLILNCVNESIHLLNENRMNRFLKDLSLFWIITSTYLRDVSLPNKLVEKMTTHILASKNGTEFRGSAFCEDQYLITRKWLPDSVMFQLIETLFQEELDRTTVRPFKCLIGDVEKYLTVNNRFCSVRVEKLIKKHLDAAIENQEILRFLKALGVLIRLLRNCIVSDSTCRTLIQLFDVVNATSMQILKHNVYTYSELSYLLTDIAGVLGNSIHNENFLKRLANMFQTENDISTRKTVISWMSEIEELPFSIQDTLVDNFDSNIITEVCKCLKEQTFLSPHATGKLLHLLKASEEIEIKVNCLDVLASQKNLSEKILDEILKLYPNKCCDLNLKILKVFNNQNEISEPAANAFQEEFYSCYTTKCKCFWGIYEVFAMQNLPPRVLENLNVWITKQLNNKTLEGHYILNIFCKNGFPQSMVNTLYCYLESKLPKMVQYIASPCLFCTESRFPNYPLMLLESMKKTFTVNEYDLNMRHFLILFSNHQHLFENKQLLHHFNRIVSKNSPNENDFKEIATLKVFAEWRNPPEELLLQTLRFLTKLITGKTNPGYLGHIYQILRGLLRKQTRLPKSVFQLLLEKALSTADYFIDDSPLIEILVNLNESNWKDLFDCIPVDYFSCRHSSKNMKDMPIKDVFKCLEDSHWNEVFDFWPGDDYAFRRISWKWGGVVEDLPITEILKNLSDSNWKEVFDLMLIDRFISQRFPFQVIQITDDKKGLNILVPSHKEPLEIKHLDVNYVVKIMRQICFAARPDFLSVFLKLRTKQESLHYVQKFRTEFQSEKSNFIVHTDILHKYLRLKFSIKNPSDEDYRNLFEELKLQLQSRESNFQHIDLRSNQLHDDLIVPLKQVLMESGAKISTLILSDNQITCCRNGLRLLLKSEFIDKIGLKYLYLDRNHIYMRGDDIEEYFTNDDSLLLKSGLSILDISGNFIPEGKLGGSKENVVAERHILQQSGIPENDLLRNVIFMRSSSKVNSSTIDDKNYSFAPICNQFYEIKTGIDGRRIGKTEGCIILAYKQTGLVGKHAFLGIDWVPYDESPGYGQRQLIRSELLQSQGANGNHFFIRILQKSPDEFKNDFTHSSILIKGVAIVSTEKISKVLKKIYASRDIADIYNYRLLASLNSSHRGEFNCITWADLMLKECEIAIDSMNRNYWI